MNVILLILGGIAMVGGIICSIFILIDAFQDELWKGLLFFLCGLYGLYYAIFEFDHEYKWPIVIGALAGDGIAGGIWGLMHH